MPDTNSMILQKIFNGKQYNTLNTSYLGGGIAQQLIHTLFLQTTCSDTSQGHLTDVLCPGNKIQVDSISHVENAGSNNKFGGRHSAW